MARPRAHAKELLPMILLPAPLPTFGVRGLRSAAVLPFMLASILFALASLAFAHAATAQVESGGGRLLPIEDHAPPSATPASIQRPPAVSVVPTGTPAISTPS